MQIPALVRIVIIVQLLGVQSCPDNCMCRQIMRNFHVDCHSTVLVDIMESIPINVKRLNMRIPNVEKIDEFFFSKYFNLHYLFIEAQSLTSIHKFAFSNLTKVEELRLRSTKITKLKANMFSGLIHLHYIEIIENRNLVSIEKNAFAGLPILDHLYITDNALECLPEDPFSELIKLKYVFLSGNKLQTINLTIFASLPNLKSITLSDNRITEVSGHLGSYNDELHLIYLHNNRLTTIESKTFANLRGLDEVRLDRNMITTIDHDAFSNSSINFYLRMNNNKITSIHRDLFKDLTNLKILYLNDNHLMTIHKDTFEKQNRLANLFLHNNKLKILDVDFFLTLQKVVELDLHNNALTVLPFMLSSIMENLLSLDLRNNQIPCTCFYLHSLTRINNTDVKSNCILKGVTYNTFNRTCDFIPGELKMMKETVTSNSTSNMMLATVLQKQYMIMFDFKVMNTTAMTHLLQITDGQCLRRHQQDLHQKTNAPKATRKQIFRADSSSEGASSKMGAYNSSYNTSRYAYDERSQAAPNNITCDIMLVGYHRKTIYIDIKEETNEILNLDIPIDNEKGKRNTLEIRQTLINNQAFQLSVFRNGQLVIMKEVKDPGIYRDIEIVTSKSLYVEIRDLAIYSSSGVEDQTHSTQVQTVRILLLTAIICLVILFVVWFLVSLETCCKRHHV